MLRDYRKGQRLSGATIERLFGDYRTRTSDYPATIEPTAATIPRLSSDYSATIGNALPEFPGGVSYCGRVSSS